MLKPIVEQACAGSARDADGRLIRAPATLDLGDTPSNLGDPLCKRTVSAAS